jgi:hypothetical protein
MQSPAKLRKTAESSDLETPSTIDKPQSPLHATLSHFATGHMTHLSNHHSSPAGHPRHALQQTTTQASEDRRLDKSTSLGLPSVFWFDRDLATHPPRLERSLGAGIKPHTVMAHWTRFPGHYSPNPVDPLLGRSNYAFVACDVVAPSDFARRLAI